VREFTKLEKRLLDINAAKNAGLSNLFNCTKGQGKIYPSRWSMRSQGHYNLLGATTSEIGDILLALGLSKSDFTTGNDAPRGGVEGHYLSLTTKGRAKIKRLMM